MNPWPRHLPKNEQRLCIEYLRCSNPVTRSVLRSIIFSHALESRNCLHRLLPNPSPDPSLLIQTTEILLK